MNIDAMDGSFRQGVVMQHFLLGLLAWSEALRAATAVLPAGEDARGAEAPVPEEQRAALQLLLGLISFDQTLRAALARAAPATTAPEPPHRDTARFGELDLAR